MIKSINFMEVLGDSSMDYPFDNCNGSIIRNE